MIADITHLIESLTPADYVSAFRQAEPAEHQLEMLRIHYAAPDHTLTAKHLARGMGYKNWNAANLHYGKFAAKVCAILNLPQEGFNRVFVLAEFFKSPGSEILLLLRPSVVTAIEQLGFVNDDVFPVQEEIDPDTFLVEGASYFVQVSAFECNPVARRKCIEHYGLNCSVCGFNFGTNYGITAKGYIHVHHLKPLVSCHASNVG